jgi:quercetin dioxygenase-like cupin family protein
MRIIHLDQTTNRERSEAAKEQLGGRRIRECGVAEFAPGCVAHDGERHVHDHDEIFLILRGDITVPIVGGPTEVAYAGDWVLVDAGEEHHLINHTDEPCVAMFLILED